MNAQINALIMLIICVLAIWARWHFSVSRKTVIPPRVNRLLWLWVALMSIKEYFTGYHPFVDMLLGILGGGLICWATWNDDVKAPADPKTTQEGSPP